MIYAKLYDEWNASRGGRTPRYLDFRIGGATPTEFSEKIDKLFQAAKRQWPGVFVDGERIDLTPSHLVTCGSFLESIKLFNSNLQIIDEAFEYLSTQVGKAKKGQYFTPRHVIDMCVEMLNPTVDEFMIDTAAGSCGFIVHTIFHVWGSEFAAEGPTDWQREFAREKIYALDFDVRSIKIAKALNLIAGDGKTNVYKANTLDPKSWTDDVKVALKPRLLKLAGHSENQHNVKNMRNFDFDVLMTNPPFAGDIKDSRVLHQYDLGKKPTGKWRKKCARDILFIERNLEFVRPGGRLCIVLPQSRLNNVSDKQIRAYLADKCRILASVSLNVNTFKPHANIKTSILFLQKWNDDKNQGPYCPKVDDYPIFTAQSFKSGKDSKGEYLYKVGLDGLPMLDAHGHMILLHDLTEISAAFRQFGAANGFRFCGGPE